MMLSAEGRFEALTQRPGEGLGAFEALPIVDSPEVAAYDRHVNFGPTLRRSLQ